MHRFAKTLIRHLRLDSMSNSNVAAAGSRVHFLVPPRIYAHQSPFGPWLTCTALICLLLTIGCESSSTGPAPAASSASTSAPPPPPPLSGSQDSVSASASPPIPPTPTADTVPPVPVVTSSQASDSASQVAVNGPGPGQEQVTADVGVGKKGRGYGGGMISEPARQYFSIRERIVFQIQIPDALKKLKALDPDGKGPASHEEFMDKIINVGNIELPELPAGEEYWYDAENEELMVLRPKP